MDKLAKAITKTKDPTLQVKFTKVLTELKPLLEEYHNFCVVLSMFPTMPEATENIVSIKVKASA